MGPWVGFTATLTVALKCVTNQVAGRCVEAVGGAMSNNEWTPERIAALIALWGEDISTSEIGRRLGITKNAVIGKVHRLGLPKRRPSPNQDLDEADVIRLDALGADMCSWPVGNPSDHGFHFCGAKTVPGKPYCAQHCASAYVKPARARSSGGGSSLL